MGYTHYWRRPRYIDGLAYGRIVDDYRRLLPALEEAGVRLGDGVGEGEPIITDDEVVFNGLRNCGHPSGTRLSIPWPSPDAGGVLSGQGAVGTWDAGTLVDTRTCDGDCSYESFSFPRVMRLHGWEEPDEQGRFFACCKTAFRPYDLAVTAFLVIAKHHLGDQIRVTSDGGPQQWFDAKLLCSMVLGYGLDVRLDFEASRRPA